MKKILLVAASASLALSACDSSGTPPVDEAPTFGCDNSTMDNGTEAAVCDVPASENAL